jgi:hypothetical protein
MKLLTKVAASGLFVLTVGGGQHRRYGCRNPYRNPIIIGERHRGPAGYPVQHPIG